MSAIEHLPGIDNGLLRFLTCGSVDDGKSTLIGRLLFDTKTILADTLHAITRTSERRGLEAVDLLRPPAPDRSSPGRHAAGHRCDASARRRAD